MQEIPFPRTVAGPALGFAFGANCYLEFPVDAPVRNLPGFAPGVNPYFLENSANSALINWGLSSLIN